MDLQRSKLLWALGGQTLSLSGALALIGVTLLLVPGAGGCSGDDSEPARGSEGEGEGESFIIKGCTPCSMDIFRYDVRLSNPKVGDSITFLNAGAYNFSSTFCNLERLPTVIVE